MADQTITCNDCGKQFTFTESEQEFYQSKGFSTPGRCPDCRAVRKAQREGGYGSSNYGERQMFPVVCAQCGKDTTVPFEPKTDKPVYCSDCFRAQPGGRSTSKSTSSSSRY